MLARLPEEKQASSMLDVMTGEVAVAGFRVVRFLGRISDSLEAVFSDAMK
jgi:hypothetical protein